MFLISLGNGWHQSSGDSPFLPSECLPRPSVELTRECGGHCDLFDQSSGVQSAMLLLVVEREKVKAPVLTWLEGEDDYMEMRGGHKYETTGLPTTMSGVSSRLLDTPGTLFPLSLSTCVGS